MLELIRTANGLGIARLVADVKLSGRAFLAESLAGVGVGGGLPCFGVERANAFVHNRYWMHDVLLALRAAFASLQLVDANLGRVRQVLRALAHLVPHIGIGGLRL